MKSDLTKYHLTYKRFGASAILIEWPSEIDEDIIRNIVAFEKSIDIGRGISDTFIAYNSLTIRYEEEVDFASEMALLKKRYEEVKSLEAEESRCWHIPICYHPEFGLDLDEISRVKKISVEEVIRLHTEPEYLIYFIGFQPGFSYLGGLDARIHMPRRANPRLRVEKGSVGIGGEQTGVYPSDSAGGWNIIGKSPIYFFDIAKPKPCFAKAGDRIKFTSIDADDFHEISAKQREGRYELQFDSL
ncbi:MAG: 5-oxoprolinase subunit PxpB [Cryomorphaceae bacterium]